MRWQTKLFLEKVKDLIPAHEFLRRTKRVMFGFHPGLMRDVGAIQERQDGLPSRADLHQARRAQFDRRAHPSDLFDALCCIRWPARASS